MESKGLESKSLEGKNLQISDLDTLQELSPEAMSPVQGGLSIASDSLELRRLPEPLIPYDPEPLPEPLPRPMPPRLPYPLPRPRPFPCHPLPLPCSPFPTKGGHLPWCAVIL